jgi:hypothetical protein
VFHTFVLGIIPSSMEPEVGGRAGAGVVHNTMGVHFLAVEGGLDVSEVLEGDTAGLVDEFEVTVLVVRIGAAARLALATITPGQLLGVGFVPQQYQPAAP